MNRFKQHRRKITRSFFVRGCEKSASSNGDTLTIPSSSGVLKKLTFRGNTCQDEGASYENPMPIKNVGGINLRGINLFNASGTNSYQENGVSVVYNDNVYRANGESTGTIGILGEHRKLVGIKPNTPYSVRLSKLSGNFENGEIRFYLFFLNPLTYIKTVCGIWDTNTSSAVGIMSFTEEEVDRGIVMGVYTSAKTGTKYNDYVFSADIVSGEYTKDNFPKFERYATPESLTVDTEVNGIDGYNDVLCLDFERKKYVTTKRVEQLFIGEMESVGMEFLSNNGENAVIINGINKKKDGTKSYSTHCPEYDENTQRDLCYQFEDINGSTRLYFYWVKQNSIEEFLTWARNENLSIAYVLENEYQREDDLNCPCDILNYNLTTVIEVDNGSEIEAVYYDLEE